MGTTGIFNMTEEEQEAARTLISGRCPWKQEPFDNVGMGEEKKKKHLSNELESIKEFREI